MRLSDHIRTSSGPAAGSHHTCSERYSLLVKRKFDRILVEELVRHGHNATEVFVDRPHRNGLGVHRTCAFSQHWFQESRLLSSGQPEHDAGDKAVGLRWPQDDPMQLVATGTSGRTNGGTQCLQRNQRKVVQPRSESRGAYEHRKFAMYA